MIHRSSIAVLGALLLGASIAFPAAVFAQERAFDPAVALERRMATLHERLSLTPEQRASVRAIQEEHIGQAGRLVAEIQATDSRREKLAVLKRLEALRQETAKRMEVVLSTAQMAAYRVLLAEQEAELRAAIKQRRAGS